jgi:4-amino-4-deoxy-L-arabinose transferase-like glycosyltransferase
LSVVAAGLAVGLAATSNGYGYHRDELYFRMLGQHPAWGYVDQPPFTPLLGRLATALLGDHVWALRAPSVLCAVATVLLLALIARELGGGKVAQVLAGLGAASGYPLIFGHVLTTASFDALVWLAVILFAIRALLREEPRWWLAAGVVTGLGLYNKHLVVLLLLCLAGGLLLVGPRRVLASRWVWIGVAVAVVIGAPNLIYQVTHDWPQLKMAQALAENKGDDARVQLLPLQLLLLGPPLAPFWIAGLVSLLRNPARRPVRALGVAYPLMLVLLFVIKGQPYYTGGLLLALYAAGAVATERWMAGRRWRQVLVGVALALNVAVSALLSLSLLPVPVLARTPIPEVNQVTRDQIGWPTYVRQVAQVYQALPAEDRAHAVVVTGNYGEAGAIDRFGPRYGLPKVYSGQNELYNLGAPPDSATVVLLIGMDYSDDQVARVESRFRSCQTLARLDNGVGIDNEEQGRGIRVCRDPRAAWQELWPEFQHYD